jgi:hypothetical protein
MKTKIFNTIIFSLLTLTSVFAQKAGPMNMAVSAGNPTCPGLSNGQIALTLSSGYPPYTYLWSNGDTTSSISNLPAGNYSVTVTDAGNQTMAGFITLYDPAPITITANQTNVTSYGLANGTIDVLSIDNVVGNYTFTWSSSTGSGFNPSTLDQSGLAPNFYKLFVVDDAGCEGVKYFQITQPFPSLPSNFKTGKVGNAASAISVFPNPSNGNFTIDFKSEGDDYRIVNLNNGIEVANGKSNGEKLNIDNLPTGNYMIYIQNGEEVRTERVSVL